MKKTTPKFDINTIILIECTYEVVMSYDRKLYPCTCSDCGKQSEVPFEPKPDRPVYCRECFPKHQKPRFQRRY
ncbi:CxxC-x17-CxxC domain-containing protein [Candidatus Nitrosotenuis uzonensis]|nr:CxxC-x17-CxxC domain-containing protein [Candidatus Nitrosotenuis uzonensis]